MIVKYSPSFIATLKKTDVRIQKSFKERIIKFSKNPLDPQLNNHKQKRDYQGYLSIDVTADWRAIYEEKQEEDEIIAYFVFLGTHQELYK